MFDHFTKLCIKEVIKKQAFCNFLKMSKIEYHKE